MEVHHMRFQFGIRALVVMALWTLVLVGVFAGYYALGW
jgi:hypothetical protein